MNDQLHVLQREGLSTAMTVARTCVSRCTGSVRGSGIATGCGDERTEEDDVTRGEREGGRRGRGLHQGTVSEHRC